MCFVSNPIRGHLVRIEGRPNDRLAEPAATPAYPKSTGTAWPTLELATTSEVAGLKGRGTTKAHSSFKAGTGRVEMAQSATSCMTGTHGRCLLSASASFSSSELTNATRSHRVYSRALTSWQEAATSSVLAPS